MISLLFLVLSAIVLKCSNCTSVKTDTATVAEKRSTSKSPQSLMIGLQEIVDNLRHHLGRDKIPEMDSFSDFIKHEAKLMKNSVHLDKPGLELIDQEEGKWGQTKLINLRYCR